ncbi:MAG: endonuclease/exonuclease/phosphatase family protein [Oscillospiraceae bacterium]|nr:endonuclease/exonuclease/phosphatase family protein [Oscillospiraceae bacterium]
MKKVLKAILILLLVIVLAVGGLLGWLTVTEYKPEDVEQLSIRMENSGAAALPAEGPISVISWNIGYGGLGKNSDFFMDGGKDARSADKMQVSEYLAGIFATLYNSENKADLVMLQEVDVDSSRTYGIDETALLTAGSGVFAYNYSCPFVPVPFPPMGKVNSGLFTTTDYKIAKAERIQLPCLFSWPLRIANLKRCLLVSYLPLEGSDKQLVLVNLHLEAYDDGEAKLAQTRQLSDFIRSEYEKGNYVIAAGDFNQIFPGGLEAWPNEHPENWIPGVLTEDMLPEGWSFVFDLETPSCRLLNQPYDPTDTVNTQYYVIDGYIVSPNVTVETVKTLDLGFADSDHNPVRLVASLVP